MSPGAVPVSRSPDRWVFIGSYADAHGDGIHIGVLAESRRELRIVASQAGVGGGTSALALARSLGRPDLTAPGILAGALGTALGTYLGFAVTGWLA